MSDIENKENKEQQPSNDEYQFRQDPQYDLSGKGENNVDDSKSSAHYNDWPFIIIFIIACCGFVAISGIVLHYWSTNTSTYGSSKIYSSTDTSTFDSNTAICFIFACVISVVLSIFGYILCKKKPRWFIVCGIIFNIVCGLGTAIMYLSLKYWSAGIVFLVFTLFSAWCYWTMRSRIPFSCEILTFVMSGINWYPKMLIVQTIGTVISLGFSIWFSLTITAAYMRFDPKGNNSQSCSASSTGSCSTSKLIGSLVVIFFCGYYITEVIRNVIHVSVSGVFGSYYYQKNSDQGPPKSPIWNSFKRAITYCFGSICFGSLIVSILETIKTVLNLVKNQFIDSSNTGGQIGMFIVNLIMSFINWLAQYFNHYAYAFIALYGKPYLASAKETYHMFRQKGMDALINDNLINVGIGFYATFVAYISTLFTYLYLRFTKPDYNANGDYTAPILAFSFVISLQIVNIINETIRSGSATFFICLGNDPEVLMHTDKEKFDKIFQAYPDVLHKLNHQDV